MESDVINTVIILHRESLTITNSETSNEWLIRWNRGTNSVCAAIVDTNID
jgi:hypothetical protein